MEVKIASSEYTWTLETEINNLLKRGYVPSGGPFVDPNGRCYYQLMVKLPKESPEKKSKA
jgi:hypothetical protein